MGIPGPHSGSEKRQAVQVHSAFQEPRRSGRRFAGAFALAVDCAAILPIYVVEELQGAKQYYIYKERCVFCDAIRQEMDSGIRIVAENEDFITLAPYAPRFPFETWILPKRHESAFENSSSHMFENLAKALKLLLMKADRVLDNPPYNLVVHSSPAQDPTNEYYHWHIEFMPKLTKTAGFEWGTGFYINPTPPEEAARFLREASVEDVTPQVVGAK